MNTNLKEHHCHIQKIGEALKDVEHFRIREEKRHIAVVVLQDGRCFVGEAECSPRDTYSRRLGYRIAVGRALAEAAEYTEMRTYPYQQVKVRSGTFTIDSELCGRELRDACRHVLNLPERHQVNANIVEVKGPTMPESVHDTLLRKDTK